MKYLLLFFFLISITHINSQELKNIKFKAPNNSSVITITYDLIDTNLTHRYFVRVYFSEHSGRNYNPFPSENVFGDVGNNITPGTDKLIQFDAAIDYPDLESDVQFMLEATPLFSDTIVPPQNILMDKRDNKNYKIGKIGDQIWMSENLAYKNTDGCWPYENNENNAARYGFLYKWNNAINVCPFGWRLPSKEDFEILLSNYENSSLAYKALTIDGNSGFSALPGGWRGYMGTFNGIGYDTEFWSSTTKTGITAWYLEFNGNSHTAILDNDLRTNANYVRCIKNN